MHVQVSFAKATVFINKRADCHSREGKGVFNREWEGEGEVQPRWEEGFCGIWRGERAWDSRE